MRDNYAYRDCTNVIEALKNGNHEEERKFLISLASVENLFFGIRNNKLQIYRSRAMVVEISYIKREDKLVYKINTTQNIEEKNASKEIAFKDLKEQFSKISEDAKNKYRDRGLFEEICQQWIVDMNNNYGTDYYYVDMEFNIQGTRLGRIDMIAISKNKENGKHKVVLIELKVGKQSISGTWKLDEEHSKESIDKRIFKGDVKHPLKFGSGIVGHIVDYYRLIGGENYQIIKESICRMLRCQKELGYLKDESLENITADDLSEKPEVVIACYTHASKKSYEPIDESKNHRVEIEELKSEVHKNLYNKIGSQYNLQDALPDELTNGFMAKVVEEPDKLEDEMLYEQDVHGEKYSFVIKFIDADREDCWKCI